MLDAYSIRKAVPRIVLAVIGINLSIYLCIAAIDITMIIGRGIDSLFVASFKNANGFAVVSPEGSTENGVLALLLGPGLIWASVAAVGFLLTSLPLVAFLALAILLTLIIRQALLIFLTVVSPVAIACFILPNTEKYFQKWADLFIKTLMVYPIVMIILAMSKVMASILIGTSTLSPDGIGAAKVIAAILVIYAPLVLIPFAFKLAGGAIGQLSNMAEGRARQKGGQVKESALKNPDSLANKFARKKDNFRSDRGLTGGQMWAGATGKVTRGDYGSRKEARRARMNAAREFDQFKNRQAASETGRFKMNSQDSDALDSAVMTKDQVAIDKNNLQRQRQLQQQIQAGTVAAGTKITVDDGFGGTKEVGGMTENEYARKMQGHARADQMGRTQASRVAAFNNADRIKFTGNDHAQEVALAESIAGGNQALIGGLMNEHQAIAKGASGRPDLSASLYGNPADLDKASESQSMYMLMNQGKPTAVKSLADQHIARISDPNATAKQKQASAAFLHSMKSAKGQGNQANNTALNEKMGAIEGAIGSHVQAQAVADMAANGQPTYREVRVEKTVPDTSPGAAAGSTVTRTATERVALNTADEIMAEAMRPHQKKVQDDSMAYNPPDPSERDKP